MARLRFKATFAIDNQDIISDAIQITEAKSSTGETYVPKIETIHVGATKNYTRYWADKLKGKPELKSGIYSWTDPYCKPVIKNHNLDEEPFGRIYKAEFGKGKNGRECIIAYPKISDPVAIQKIKDGRYKTVSVGAETDEARCSICGTNIVEEGMCGHRRGQKYDEKGNPDPNGQVCYWDIGNIWFEELSFVNVPADPDAGTVDLGESYTEIEQEGGTSSVTLTKEQLLELKNQLTGVPEASQEVPSETPEPEVVVEEGLETEVVVEEEVSEQVIEEEAPETLPVEESETTEEVHEEDATPVEPPVVEIPIVESPQEDNTAQTLAEALDTIQTLTTQLTDAVNTSLSLIEQIDGLQSRIISAEQENETLLSENASLQAVMHSNLVERVVDLKRALKKPNVSNRDEAIQEHTERTTESLNDQLNDLLQEADNIPLGTFVVEKVENPSLVIDESRTNIHTEENNTTQQVVEELTAEDVFKALFGGRKSKKEAN